MKYIIRAIKYFVYICVFVSLIMAVLVALKVVSSDINVMFRNGWGSVGQIAIMFALVSLAYPRFGYTSRGAVVKGEYSEIRGAVVACMERRGYRLEKEEGENMTFRSTSAITRLLRVYEDRITLTRDFAGFSVEGPTKDVTRIVYALESSMSAAADNAE